MKFIFVYINYTAFSFYNNKFGHKRLIYNIILVNLLFDNLIISFFDNFYVFLKLFLINKF